MTAGDFQSATLDRRGGSGAGEIRGLQHKEMPLVDLAAAGGWKDYPTLLRCYQQTDAASMLRVMECSDKLRDLEK